MNEITINAYAKINLTLDVKGVKPDGMHEVEMLMHQVELHDEVTVSWVDQPGVRKIIVETDSDKLPDGDKSNLAYKAAMHMCRDHGQDKQGIMTIRIKKNIPIAAGLAGGSSDCAAVIHAVNQLWDKNISLKDLCEIGKGLGSDVPFCIMGQSAANLNLKKVFWGDELVTHFALAVGTGTDLFPVYGIRTHLVLSKPDIEISTADAYRGIDEIEIPVHPDTGALLKGVRSKDMQAVKDNLVNVLENYSVNRHPEVKATKDKMLELLGDGVLMSGSGPTVFGLCDSEEEALAVCEEMKKMNEESFATRTTY